MAIHSCKDTKANDCYSALLKLQQDGASGFSAQALLDLQKEVSETLLTATLAKVTQEHEGRKGVEAELTDLRAQLVRNESKLENTSAELRKERLARAAAESKLEDALAKLEREKVEKDAADSALKDLSADLAQKRLDISAAQSKLNDTLAELEMEREQRQAAEKRLSDLQVQKHAAHHGACWQYEMDGHWHPFSPEGNAQMHHAYLTYIQHMQCFTAKIVAGGVERVVDFKAMTQTHVTTWKKRNIRIVAGVPPQWVSTPAALLTQRDNLATFYVEVQDAGVIEWANRILRSTGHASDAATICSHMKKATIKSVHRIENFQLWHRYQARLAAMREDQAKYNVSVWPADLDLDGVEGTMGLCQSHFDCGEPLAGDVDEKILLHGTSWQNANSIVMHGFDHRTCTRGMYGDGVYFASAACKSHQYSCGIHTGKTSCTCKCERTLIIARVALGDAYYASSTQYGTRKPPNRTGKSGTHGSITVRPGPISGHHGPNQLQVHQEFVVFDREQAYPAFVVQYLP